MACSALLLTQGKTDEPLSFRGWRRDSDTSPQKLPSGCTTASHPFLTDKANVAPHHCLQGSVWQKRLLAGNRCDALSRYEAIDAVLVAEPPARILRESRRCRSPGREAPHWGGSRMGQILLTARRAEFDVWGRTVECHQCLRAGMTQVVPARSRRSRSIFRRSGRRLAPLRSASA